MNENIPEIRNDFICIVNWSSIDLAAVISSYISRPGLYLPIFEFPSVLKARPEDPKQEPDEHRAAIMHAEQFDVITGNCIGRVGGCKYLILAGLSPEQRSYLKFLDKYNTIDIASIEEVDFYLGELCNNKNGTIECNPDEILKGLQFAIYTNAKLKINPNAAKIPEFIPAKNNGLFVIEDTPNASSIIALNYAIAFWGDIKIVERIKLAQEFIVALLQDWRNGDQSSFQLIEHEIVERIGDLNLCEYKFVTFLTEGLPYTLIAKNVIPSCYIHLNLRIDYFIFNNLYFEKRSIVNSGVVFSPEFFPDEETTEVIESLKTNNFLVTEILGKSATVHNIDMHIKEFPYNLMHICSHGGEVSGYAITEKFLDRDGNEHTIEYDEVPGFAPVPGQDLIAVHRKTIFRKLDGLKWRSPELKAEKYPSYVFDDMPEAMSMNFKNDKQIRIKKNNIPGSCAIKCVDSIHQGMFHTIAGMHASPLIFNNTCWSWSNISEHFLTGGAKGYIGTLWAIDNKVASESAKEFYRTVFGTTILNAIHKACACTKGTSSADIYIFWGTHFSTLRPGINIDRSKTGVARSLLISQDKWDRMLEKDLSEEIKQNITKLRDWDIEQLEKNFLEEAKKIMVEVKQKAEKQKQSA